jgi:hypothetical protein
VSAAILAFPPRNHGRVRKTRSMEAAGLLSMLLLERDGELIPANVQRIDEPEGFALPARSPELLLALLIFATLPEQQQERVRRAIRCAAYNGKADYCAIKLNNALNGRGREQ